jgi:Ketosteroid isomerase homolog
MPLARISFLTSPPLKYSSWDEYQKNVTNVLADYKSATCSVNEPELHPAGSYVRGTAIVKAVMTHKDGKVDTDNFRWTMIFEKQNGKWLIVHEHLSVPLG